MADAMIDMNDIISHLQVSVHGLGCFGNRPLAGARLRPLPPEHLRICDQMEGRIRSFTPQGKTF
jgi:hypothetical protein